jgi:hypothetical protein
MIIQGQVGPLASSSSISAGQQTIVRQGNMGDLIASELHGRYYEAAYRKSMFAAANPSAVTTTVGVATTYVGICLSNPISSTVNLVLNKVGYAFLVAFPAASTVGLMTGYNSGTNVTHTTPLTPKSLFTGQAAGVGLVDSSATLPTAPTLTHVFAAGLTGAITTSEIAQSEIVDLEGSIILPPGGYAAVFTSTVSGTSAFWGSMSWEEVPL